MLRITQQSSSAGAKSYFSQSDYYIDGQEHEGHWGGRGAKLLGLAGVVERDAFHALCDNQRPDGTGMLTARTITERTVGYDFTFNVPKSVSIVAALTKDNEIQKAVEEAVQETMQEVEAGMQTRVRKHGKEENRTTGNMIWASFTHHTSRPVNGVPDPHLHVHAFAFNATFDTHEQQWKAGQFQGLKRDGRYYEAAFHARLARKMHHLGYGIERNRSAYGWELAGLSKETLDAFSRRTALIEKLAKEKGITNPDDKSELGAKSRESKDKSLTLTELRKDWLGRLDAVAKSALAAIGAKLVPDTEPLIDAKTAMAWAVDHAFTRSAVLREKVLLATALRQGVGGVTVSDVWKELKGHGILRRKEGDMPYVTTQTVLREEKEVVAFAKSGRGTCPALGIPEAPLSREDWLTEDQKKAVRHVLDSFDRVMMIRGAAGTGKTKMMEETVEGIRAGGHEVVVLAPSVKASRGVLRGEGFENADTVARFLIDKQFQLSALHQVIWVDEAGMLSGRQIHQLFDVAKSLGARVVLQGDEKQHRSVERGDTLRMLQKQAGLPVAELREIKRQRGLYRDAVAMLSEGHTGEGLKILDQELGWIKELPDGDREKELADDYIAALKQGKSVLAVSPTHAEADAVTAAIRSALKAEGRVAEEEHVIATWKAAHLTHAEQRDKLSFQKGDLLEFHKRVPGFYSQSRLVYDGQSPLPLDRAEAFQVFRPSSLRLAAGDTVQVTARGTTKDRKHRMSAGSTYTVAGFTPQGDISLTNGWVIGKDFGHLTHGYVVTSWASQGTTVDKVFVAQSFKSFPASSPEQLYVSASRGRESLTLYTDDRHALREAVGHSEERKTAMELMQSRPRAWMKNRIEQFRRWRNGLDRARTQPTPEPRKELRYD